MSITDLVTTAGETLSGTARAVHTRAMTAYLTLPMALIPSVADAHPGEESHVHGPQLMQAAAAGALAMVAVGCGWEFVRERRRYRDAVEGFEETRWSSPGDARTYAGERHRTIAGQVFYGMVGGVSAIYSAVLTISAMPHHI